MVDVSFLCAIDYGDKSRRWQKSPDTRCNDL